MLHVFAEVKQIKCNLEGNFEGQAGDAVPNIHVNV